MTHRASPSQITTARACLRRWWWQSVKGYKAPPTASTIFGGRVHEVLEHRVQYGAWPLDADPEVLIRAESAYTALVQQIGAWQDPEVEGGWTLPAGDYALPASGRYDLLLPERNIVVDWKTTTDLKWAKSDEERETDPQVIMYVDALHREGKLLLPALFLHVYTVTKGKPRAEVKHTLVDEARLSIGRAEINKTMQQMQSAVDEQDYEKVPANVLACKDYGGCPHYERCFPQQQEPTMNADEIKNAFASRRAQKGMVNPPESAPPPQIDLLAPNLAQQVEALSPVATTITVATYKQPRRLYIGCAPFKGEAAATLFDDWVQPHVAQAQERLKVPYWGLADFGKGKTAIVASVAEAAGRGDLPACLIVDRRSALGDACCEVLMQHYDTVIAKLG